jgi:hypothetical protein
MPVRKHASREELLNASTLAGEYACTQASINVSTLNHATLPVRNKPARNDACTLSRKNGSTQARLHVSTFAHKHESTQTRMQAET